jgi:hypothetical protein
VIDFEEAIKGPKIQIQKIRSMAFDGEQICMIFVILNDASTGIPESNGLRSVYWKILLNYLPLDRTMWSSFLGSKRKTYNDWVKDLIVDPYEKVTLMALNLLLF